MANIMGTNGSDFINGTNGPDNIDAKGGHDTVNARNGNDTVKGGSGNDDLSGGRNNDIVNGGTGNDLVKGNENNDVLNGEAGNDILIGGAGNDTFKYASAQGDDRIQDFGFGVDKIDLTDAAPFEIFGVYGNVIEANPFDGDVDPGVSVVAGNLVIDFGAAPFPPFPGFGDLTVAGVTSLDVGSEVV